MNNLIEENFPQCMTWNLCNYSRWLNFENNQVNDNVEKNIKEWRSTPGCEIELRLTKFGHFLITAGFNVLESYFLVDAKHWFKATIKDNDILILIKYQKNFRRICLGFKTKEECLSCLTELDNHVSVKSIDIENQQDNLNNNPLNFKGLLSQVYNNSLSITEWPKDHLNHMIKICLFDPNFPGFVAEVEKELSNILTE